MKAEISQLAPAKFIFNYGRKAPDIELLVDHWHICSSSEAGPYLLCYMESMSQYLFVEKLLKKITRPQRLVGFSDYGYKPKKELALVFHNALPRCTGNGHIMIHLCDEARGRPKKKEAHGKT